MYKKTIAGILVLLTLGLLFVSVPPARARFALSSWDFPDEYGQGIDTITVEGNSTGSWVSVGNYEYDEASVLDWNASVAINLKCWTWFNSTLTGASSTNDGKNYQRHNVIVTALGVTVFSQQNFTYSNVYTEEAPMWYYVYEVVLNFLTVAGNIYVVTITYEVFY